MSGQYCRMKDGRTDSRRTLNTAADARIMGQGLLTGHENHPTVPCDEPIHNQPDTRVLLPTIGSGQQGAANKIRASAADPIFDKPFAREKNRKDKSHTECTHFFVSGKKRRSSMKFQEKREWWSASKEEKRQSLCIISWCKLIRSTTGKGDFGYAREQAQTSTLLLLKFLWHQQ